MHHLSVGCVFKNESHALHEFIEHNLHHGVDHVFLIDDFSSDDYMNIVKPYIDAGKVTLFRNDIVTQTVGRQQQIYEKYLRPVISWTTWLAIVDADEFIYAPTEPNLKNAIGRYESDYDCIKIKWKIFGSNQCHYQPLAIVSGFNKHCDGSGPSDRYAFKSIMRASTIISFGIHQSQLSSDRVVDATDMWVNHYQIQSKDFYMKIKSTRGDADNWYPTYGYTRDLARFEANDLNHIECNELVEQNRPVTRRVKAVKVAAMTDDDVTVVITACNRPYLLRPTIDSFIRNNTYPIKEFIVIEDSGIQGVNDFLVTEPQYAGYRFNLIYNKKNKGQMASIDAAYEYVTTKYVFHCEEDWNFKKTGFIETSLDILKGDPKIFTVWLRPHYHTSGHPVDHKTWNGRYFLMQKDYIYHWRGVDHVWCGFTFNPGLRRTEDILKYHPYCVNIEKDPLLGHVGEYMVNAKYREDGYYAAITPEYEGYVEHIGEGHHVAREYD